MFKSYLKNTAGNFSLLFGTVMVTLVVSVGVAIDYAGLSQQSQSVQDILDSAVLAASNYERQSERSEKEIEVYIQEFINETNMTGYPIEAEINISDDQIGVIAKANYTASLLNVVGVNTLPIAVNSGAPRHQDTPLNIALVLDTTDSMEINGNFRPLQRAVDNLLTELDKYEAEVRVSLVPFGDYVNVGVTNASEARIDTSKNGLNFTQCVDETRIITPRVCRGTGEFRNRVTRRDGVVIGTSSREVQNCTDAVTEPTGNTICTDQTLEWRGCAGSRNAPDNLRADASSALIPGAMSVDCGSELIPLTTDLNTIRREVRNLTAAGNTYLPAGLHWGWRTLSPSQPYQQVNDSPDNTINAIIFMTDGANTRSQGGSYGSLPAPELHASSEGGPGLDVANSLCENISADDIRIFTVAYRFTGEPAETEATETLLRSCAGTENNYFEADNSAQLSKAFRDISRSLFFVRLSQ